MTSRGVDRRGLAALLPVRAEAVPELAALLARPEALDPSPFGRIESTHFARLVLVPPMRPRGNRAVSGVPPCLLFAAEFDGTAGGYVEAVCHYMPDEADTVFGHCVGYPGARRPVALWSWLRAHRVSPGFSLHAHARATVGDIRTSLRLRGQLIAFAFATQNADPDTLARQWAARPWREA